MKVEKQNKDEVKIISQKQVEKKRVLMGSLRVNPGHRCFEINTKTNDINEAQYTIEATFGNGIKKSVDIKDDCVYIMALNKKNALKKYLKPITNQHERTN